MQLRYVLCAAILATCVSTAIHAEIIHGRVDRVIDGDTLQVITADDEIRVRIRGIDAPEARASEILCPWDNRSLPNGCIQ